MQLSRKALPAEGKDIPGNGHYYPSLSLGLFRVDVALISHSGGCHHTAYVTLPAVFQSWFSESDLEVHGGITWDRAVDETWTIGFDYRHVGDPENRSDPAWVDYFGARDAAVALARQITKHIFPEELR